VSVTYIRSWRDRRAVAALEFALVAPVLLMFFGGAVDLGLAVWSQSCVASAVAQGAQYAVRTQLGGTNVTQAQIQAVVQAASTLSGVSATSTTVPAYYCVSAATTPATLSSSSSGTTCADGTKAALYVHVVGSYTYTPVVPGFDKLANLTITESTWARLQ
jgi:Flp pilus assembly protein TadG